jgi:hypothetical protein
MKCGSVTTSVRGDAALEWGKRGDDVNWADANLIELKIKENSHGRFNWYNWTVMI